MRIAVYGGSTWQKKHSKGFARWYVRNYIPKNIHSKLSVNVCLYENQKSWKKTSPSKDDIGYCEYIEEDKLLGNEHCKITLYSPKNLLYFKFLTRLAHEFTHVGQYVTHDLRNYSGHITFKKQKFEDGVEYWGQPWEWQAHALEVRLAKLYCEQAKIKNEVFTKKIRDVIE